MPSGLKTKTFEHNNYMTFIAYPRPIVDTELKLAPGGYGPTNFCAII